MDEVVLWTHKHKAESKSSPMMSDLTFENRSRSLLASSAVSDEAVTQGAFLCLIRARIENLKGWRNVVAVVAKLHTNKTQSGGEV